MTDILAILYVQSDYVFLYFFPLAGNYKGKPHYLGRIN